MVNSQEAFFRRLRLLRVPGNKNMFRLRVCFLMCMPFPLLCSFPFLHIATRWPTLQGQFLHILLDPVRVRGLACTVTFIFGGF